MIKPFKPFAHLRQFNFMAWRHFWVWSSVVAVAVMLSLTVFLGLNWGIDFVGGKLVEVRTAKPLSVHEVREAVEKLGYMGGTFQEFGAPNEFLIRLPGSDPKVAAASTEQGIQQNLQAVAGGAEIRRVEFVGPQVGGELRTTGFLAILVSFAAILFYIWVRFELRYGLGAILSLAHDVVLTIGIMALLRMEITLTVLAAILTLIGYSLNDTIVIFDRIRENRVRYPNKAMSDVLNQSVNQTLGRTIMTVSTVLLVLLALFFEGGEVIRDFAEVLIIGVLLGTYSSVFVASPMLLALEEYYRKNQK